MPPFGDGRIHPNPTTPSQLRAALAAAQLQSDTNAAAIAAVESDVADLQQQVGPITAVFDATGAIGQPVYVASAGHVALGDADAANTSGVVGLVYTAATSGNNGEYLAQGVITQADWTAVIGTASLTAGSVYYLSATTGQLTTTAPSAVGQRVVRCGRALTANDFHVSIEPGVLL